MAVECANDSHFVILHVPSSQCIQESSIWIGYSQLSKRNAIILIRCLHRKMKSSTKSRATCSCCLWCSGHLRWTSETPAASTLTVSHRPPVRSSDHWQAVDLGWQLVPCDGLVLDWKLVPWSGPALWLAENLLFGWHWKRFSCFWMRRWEWRQTATNYARQVSRLSMGLCLGTCEAVYDTRFKTESDSSIRYDSQTMSSLGKKLGPGFNVN